MVIDALSPSAAPTVSPTGVSDIADLAFAKEAWSFVSGNWSWTGAGVTQSDATASELMISMVVSLTPGSDRQVGVVFRTQTVSSSLADAEEYSVWIDASASGTSTAVVLGVSISGTLSTLLVTSTEAIVASTEYSMMVKAVGVAIEVNIDGNLVISTTDSTFASGAIGRVTHGGCGCNCGCANTGHPRCGC